MRHVIAKCTYSSSSSSSSSSSGAVYLVERRRAAPRDRERFLNRRTPRPKRPPPVVCSPPPKRDHPSFRRARETRSAEGRSRGGRDEHRDTHIFVVNTVAGSLYAPQFPLDWFARPTDASAPAAPTTHTNTASRAAARVCFCRSDAPIGAPHSTSDRRAASGSRERASVSPLSSAQTSGGRGEM
jgi:hypothetical protein